MFVCISCCPKGGRREARAREREREAMLDAYAPAFHPVYTDQHSLYLTFSNGFPLTERQVFDFFNRIYAPYVEQVSVHRPKRGSRQSLFGKVVFKHLLIPGLVMGNNDKVSFSVDGCSVYCRRFVTQKTKTSATASTSLHDGISYHSGYE